MNSEGLITGIIKRHPDGFGFVIPDDSEHPDVFVARGEMDGVMTNDHVEIEVFRKKQSDRFYGKIKQVLEHGITRVVGRFRKDHGGGGYIQEGVSQWGSRLMIPFKHSRGAIDDDLVAVEITQYPFGGKDFVGRVVDVIGDAEDPLNDVTRILHEKKIPQAFSSGTTMEAQALADHVTDRDREGRVDLRQTPLITIDGVTAKDFDDAVYVESTPKGFRVLVAIADVSHYVKIGSSLDDDAYERGTSVYFPGFVVPMLPEKISNGLCSLVPEQDRLALVCEMDVDFQGVLQESKVYEAVIFSHARVTYGEAQDVIAEVNKHSKPEVQENILTAANLAKILMAKRFREGSLDLDIPESEVVLDESGQPIDIIRSERVFAHKVIEELMLLANVCVAEKLSAAEVPALYRVHEEPEKENVDVLQTFLHNFGSQKKLKGGHLQTKITKSLQEFTGKPEGLVLSILTLRSMKQARYCEQNLGHFGLGFESYTHFTSPIRRYPDLIVHRLLKYLFVDKKKYPLMPEEKMITAGTVLSSCEQRAVKAERQLVSVKKARFMEDMVGKSFDGVISSVVKFGVFVLLRQYDVDGLVKKEMLGNDVFVFDEENLFLRGKKTGLTFKIGDTVRITVAAVYVDEGKIDFTLEGGLDAKMDHKTKPNKAHHKKRGSSKKHSKSSRKVRFSGRRTKK